MNSVRLGDGALRRRGQIDRVVVPGESAATRARELDQDFGNPITDEASPCFVGRTPDAPRRDLAVELVPVRPADVFDAMGPPETPEDAGATIHSRWSSSVMVFLLTRATPSRPR